MCHQAEIVLSWASRLMLSRFSAIVQRDDHREDDEDRRRLGADDVREPQVEQGRGERGGAVVDGGGHRDLADEVEPTGEPAPRRAAQLGRPEVEGAGRRHRRGDLTHRHRDEDRERADEQPAPRDRDRSAVVERDEVRGQTAGQDRDDGERDGEVGEPAHLAVQHLGIAQAMQQRLVRMSGLATVTCRHDSLLDLSVSSTVLPAARATGVLDAARSRAAQGIVLLTVR